MLAVAAAACAAAAAIVAVAVGMTVIVEMVMGMGMVMDVVVAVGMLMGVRHTIVGVLVRMFVGVLVGVITAANMIVMDMHNSHSFSFFLIITKPGGSVNEKGGAMPLPNVLIAPARYHKIAPFRSCFL